LSNSDHVEFESDRMSKESGTKSLQVSPEIKQAVSDGQRLVNYISRDGGILLDREIAQTITEAKFKIAGEQSVGEQWTVQDEKEYLLCYDKLASVISPVTVESIHAVIPTQFDKKGSLTKAERAVAWYRRYTMLALFLLILTQIYYLFGNDLNQNLRGYFDERERLSLKIYNLPSTDRDREISINEIKLLNQNIDANYKLLMTWNRIWLFGASFSETLPWYTQKKFELEKKVVARESNNNETEIDKQALEQDLYKARLVYFSHLLSAEAMLQVLHNYVLPLLYGLLGAFIFVLRSLLSEIKSVTYTYDSEIRYRLRLTLGALGGMIVGWFLKPDEGDVTASVSSMSLAFLMGYNVDVLFSLMDKIIDNIKKNIDKPSAEKTSAEKSTSMSTPTSTPREKDS
jgi:hypothetical protein